MEIHTMHGSVDCSILVFCMHENPYIKYSAFINNSANVSLQSCVLFRLAESNKWQTHAPFNMLFQKERRKMTTHRFIKIAALINSSLRAFILHVNIKGNWLLNFNTLFCRYFEWFILFDLDLLCIKGSYKHECRLVEQHNNRYISILASVYW